ncbi:MAG: hypothetical protein COB36_11895 [Alphaproteobacteria bacterium]|nr:MAG: hypothetical protein COB36_11895 [Alphaproteobacteria bacterium]
MILLKFICVGLYIHLDKCKHRARMEVAIQRVVDVDDVENTINTEAMMDSGHNFAMVGLLIALFAFCLSVTTPWILDEFAPPPPTIEDIAVEKVINIKDKLLLSFGFGVAEVVDGAEKEAAEKEEAKHWTDYWSLIVILIALGGIINGALGFMRKDTQMMAGVAIFFGISAIIAQYMMIMFAVLVLILLVVGILSALGVSF